MSDAVLVTGAFGLVGTATVKHLAARGRHVVATDLDAFSRFALDVLHAYDPAHETLFYGSGDRRTAQNVALIVRQLGKSGELRIVHSHLLEMAHGVQHILDIPARLTFAVADDAELLLERE